MSKLDCFKKVKVKGLQEKFEKLYDPAMTIEKQREVGLKIVAERYKELFNELGKLKSQGKYVAPDFKKVLELVNEKSKNWKDQYKEADAFKKSQILRAITDGSKSDKELNEVLDLLVKGSPEESNIAWSVANNPSATKETFERAVSNRALKKSTTEENIQSLREKKFGSQKSPDLGTQTTQKQENNGSETNLPVSAPQSQASILSGDFDLNGNKKQFAYQYDKNGFIERVRKAINDKVYYVYTDGKLVAGRYVAQLRRKSDDKFLTTTWVIPEGNQKLSKKDISDKAIAPLAESLHLDSVEKAIKDGDFNRAVEAGIMSQSDVDTVVSSQNLSNNVQKVPESGIDRKNMLIGTQSGHLPGHSVQVNVQPEVKTIESGQTVGQKSKIEVAKDQIAEGLDELVTALGGKANMMGQDRASVVKALRKIGDGLINAGLATAANVAQKIKEYLQEKGVLLDVDSYLNEMYEPTYDNSAIFTSKEKERQANINPELSDVGRMYGTVSNELLTKEAARIAQDPAGERDVLNMGNDMNPALRRATSLEIAKKYKQEGDRENAQRMFDHYAKLGGDYAQAVQYGQVAADDPWVLTQSVVRKSRTENEKILAQPTPDGTVKETLQVAQSQLKEIGSKYGVEVAESDTVDSVIAKVLEKTSQQKLADSKEKISKARAERTNIIKAFKSNPSKYIDFGKAYSSVVPVPVLTKEGVQMAVKLARTYMTEGAASVEIAIAKVKEFLESQLGIKISDNDLKRISDEFNDAVVTKKANRIITKYTGQAKPKAKPVTVPNEDKLIIEKIRQLAGDQAEAIVDNYLTDKVNKAMVAKEIKEIIKQHYKGESYREGIADRLVNELGLAEADAKLIQSIVKREFEKRAKAEAEKILTNTYGKASIPKPAAKAKTDADLIFEAINMGAFNDQFYRDLVGDKFGLVSLSDENVIELEKLADAIQSLQAGERKNRKLAEFYDYINKLKKVDRKFERIADHALEMYYTSMLSGYSTVARGLKGAAMTSSFHMMAGTLANPRATFQGLQGLKAFYRGATSFGWDSFKSILKDGYNPIDYFDRGMTGTSPLTKIVNTPLNELDAKKKAIKLFMYLPTKMTRMLYANDAIFRYGVREYEAYIEKYNGLIHEGGSPGEAKFWTRLNKELALDKTSQLESERQLEQEMAEMKANGENIPLGYDKRRLQEIVEEKRGEKLTKSANDKANQAVLMNDPVGLLGGLYRMMAGIGVIRDNDTKSKVIGKLVFRSIFPFMRVPTNFINTTLDYTPVGLVRAIRGGRETREGWREMTPDEKTRHYVKSAIGATVFTSLLVSIFDWDDEEGFILDPEGPIQVTANGKGDFTENTQITEDYKQFSFRLRKTDGTFTKWFSYQDNPIGMVLAPLGFMSDEIRFKDFKKTVNDRNYEPEARGMGYFGENALWMALNFSSSQTYQQGLKKLLDLTGMNTSSEYNETNISSILYSPVKATAFPNLYKQTYQQAKALMGKPEKMAFSVPEKMLKDIPIFEELIDQEQHDQFGYPITRPLDWPLVPDAILDPMKQEIDRRQDKKEWKLIYKYPEVTVGPRFRFPTKLNLSSEEKAKWSKMAGDKLREMVDANYSDLSKMKPLELQRRINRYKSIATQYATANVRKK